MIKTFFKCTGGRGRRRGGGGISLEQRYMLYWGGELRYVRYHERIAYCCCKKIDFGKQLGQNMSAMRIFTIVYITSQTHNIWYVDV